jgi:hypothetical protein
MKFSTETIKKMAEIMVDEMEQVGMLEEQIREIESGMRELLRAVGAEALSQALEHTDDKLFSEQVRSCECGGSRKYHSRRKAAIVSSLTVNLRMRNQLAVGQA